MNSYVGLSTVDNMKTTVPKFSPIRLFILLFSQSYQYLSQNSFIIIFHGNHSFVCLNLAQNISWVHHVTCNKKIFDFKILFYKSQFQLDRKQIRKWISIFSGNIYPMDLSSLNLSFTIWQSGFIRIMPLT